MEGLGKVHLAKPKKRGVTTNAKSGSDSADNLMGEAIDIQFPTHIRWIQVKRPTWLGSQFDMLHT